MKIINSFKNFKINENVDVESPSSCKAASLTGEVTLGSECIVGIKDDTACEFISVKQYKG